MHLAASCGRLTHFEAQGGTKPVGCAVLRGMAEPDDIEAFKAASAKAEAELATERAARLTAEAKVSSINVLIASLKLQIEKLQRELYGQRSERKARLLDQMDLELEASATEDELEVEMAALRSGWPAASIDQGTTGVKAFTRRKPSRNLFPEHLLRERGVIRAAIMYTLISTAKLNDIDPQAWLADILKRIVEHPARRLDELLP